MSTRGAQTPVPTYKVEWHLLHESSKLAMRPRAGSLCVLLIARYADYRQQTRPAATQHTLASTVWLRNRLGTCKANVRLQYVTVRVWKMKRPSAISRSCLQISPDARRLRHGKAVAEHNNCASTTTQLKGQITHLTLDRNGVHRSMSGDRLQLPLSDLTTASSMSCSRKSHHLPKERGQQMLRGSSAQRVPTCLVFPRKDLAAFGLLPHTLQRSHRFR